MMSNVGAIDLDPGGRETARRGRALADAAAHLRLAAAAMRAASEGEPAAWRIERLSRAHAAAIDLVQLIEATAECRH